jgi:signal transduction histidine kinase
VIRKIAFMATWIAIFALHERDGTMNGTAVAASRKHMTSLDTSLTQVEMIHDRPGGQMGEAMSDERTSGLAATVTILLDRLERAEQCSQTVLDEQRRFAADAAHALRTPLAALRIELEEARLHADQTDLNRLIARTLSAVDRLQEVIEKLHLLSAPPVSGERTHHAPRLDAKRHGDLTFE